MEHGAAPSLPDGYTRSLVGRPALPEFGPCGMAVALREPVLVEDIAADERWTLQDWRGLALAHGLRACWSAPILSPSGAALGTFAIYWPAPARPDQGHEHVIHQMTYIAALAIERGHAAAALARDDRPPAGAESRSVREAVERVMRGAGPDAPAIRVLHERYASLTPREREVMTWVVAGLPNKRIGGELGTAEITVKVHRGRVMQKMGAASLPELVRMAARLDVPLPG
jgi:DNA-binding CsgD family transcriptional regulator